MLTNKNKDLPDVVDGLGTIKDSRQQHLKQVPYAYSWQLALWVKCM
jgi:hypothetical protein